MKTVSNNLKDVLRNSHHVYSQMRVVAEWNYNRYADIQHVQNGTTSDLYPELFPIKSITDPRRPQKSGIAKMFTDEDILNTGLETTPPRARSYICSEDDPYKYWVSPVRSNAIAQPGFIYDFPEIVQPEVVYVGSVRSNKIVIGLENTFVNVKTSRVQVTYDGTTWTTIRTNPTVDLNGQIILYRQAGGSWTTTVSYVNHTSLRGVRYIVDGIDEPDTHVAVIEISARLENNLTDFVQSIDADYEVADKSFIAPMGVASSNKGSVTLSNIDGRFSNNNTSSLYYNLLDRGVKFTIDMGIEVNSETEWVRFNTMYSESSWAGQTSEEVNVSLTDSASFMQDDYTPELFFENRSIGSIIWTLCDVMGYTNFSYAESSLDRATRVPYFWATGEETLWDVIKSLAEGTQTAVFFDEYDVLQIRSRNSIYDLSRPVDWTFDGIKNGAKLPDIIEYNQEEDYEANSVSVRYQTTSVSDFNNGTPKMEPVWEPESLVLRASPLVKTMAVADMTFTIDPAQALTWPYSGSINIDGEIIDYDGKEYKYYDVNDAPVIVVIKTQDEKDNIDKNLSSDTLYWKNSTTGKFVVTARGQRDTDVRNHRVTARTDAVKRVLGDYSNTFENYVPGEGTVKKSLLNITTHSTWDHTKNLVWGYPSSFTKFNSYFGTRLRINSGVGPTGQGEAGVFFGANSNYRGYYVSLHTTESVEEDGRKNFTEVIIWVKRYDGTQYQAARAEMEVLRDKWYDLDVGFRATDTVNTITVIVDGVLRAQANITGSDRCYNFNGYQGVQSGTWCSADFEYFYAVEAEAELTYDESQFFNVQRGAFMSTNVDKKLLMGLKKAVWRDADGNIINDNSIFDDFGSWVHEVRDFDVQFENGPVTHSRIYMSNDYQATCTDYLGEPFSAKFTLSNTHRGDAILKGEDKVTFGADNSVEQQTFVYARTVNQDDEKTYDVKSDSAIRRRSEVKSEFTSKWIQNELTAKALGDWVIKNWAGGADEVSLEVFGNPLVQLGDLVSINLPVKNIDPNNYRYFVVGINHSYEEGLETTLVLRRAKTT